MAANWKGWAAEAMEQGYLPGNEWEKMLERHMKANLPDVTREFQEEGEFQEFLTARTWAAMQMQESLVADGTPFETARELALKDLFPEPD